MGSKDFITRNLQASKVTPLQKVKEVILHAEVAFLYITHLKRDHLKRKIVFQPAFSGDVLVFRG